MSSPAYNTYMETRTRLNGAMENFIRAAEKIDKDPQQIADDVGDALCDASNREIIFVATDIK